MYPYVSDKVSKLTIDGMKLSLLSVDLMVFQSGASVSDASFNNIKQIDSRASLTTAGGFAIDLTSDNDFFLIPLTAKCLRGWEGNISFAVILGGRSICHSQVIDLYGYTT